MKIIINLTFILLPTILFSQIQTDVVHDRIYTQVELLLDSAKREFKKDSFEQDYDKVIQYLEKAVTIEPDNTEVLYYLGYGYSRKNSGDGKTLYKTKRDLVIKSSEQFEKIIKIQPEYTGDIIVLDPYSKITSEWGSLATSYLYYNKKDSAIWAFNQGKKRGGFNRYTLELNKRALNTCKPNSILITAGDAFEYSLQYLQTVEQHRKDIHLINVELLGSIWYPHYLLDKKLASFDIPINKIDTIEYEEWSSQLITINNFSWTVKPVYYDKYLWRNSVLLLSLLKENNFERDVYFTIGVSMDSKLNLEQHLIALGSVETINISKNNIYSFETYRNEVEEILKLTEYININSPDETFILNIFRYNVWLEISNLINQNKTNQAKQLMILLDIYTSQNKYPYKKPLDNWIFSIRQRLTDTH